MSWCGSHGQHLYVWLTQPLSRPIEETNTSNPEKKKIIMEVVVIYICNWNWDFWRTSGLEFTLLSWRWFHDKCLCYLSFQEIWYFLDFGRKQWITVVWLLLRLNYCIRFPTEEVFDCVSKTKVFAHQSVRWA